jgi:hypothetical protein
MENGGVLTRKDFELIARIISSLPATGLNPDRAAYLFAEAFEDAFERFDSVRFITACHLEEVMI